MTDKAQRNKEIDQWVKRQPGEPIEAYRQRLSTVRVTTNEDAGIPLTEYTQKPRPKKGKTDPSD